ncbi:MAG TPA: ABC transporter permease [Hyphomicrobiales bacterium]|nr:ABC transporter permease [Hyphomicrobiales bacterium]
MARFLARRAVVALLVAITVSVLSFALLRLSGDLAAQLAGEGATDAQIRATAHLYGLDAPFYLQYLHWLGGALHGNLGKSLFTGQPVADIIARALPVTARLAFFSLILIVVLAIPLGVLAATRRNSWIDRLALSFAAFGQAIPSFWFALILMLVFGVWLKWTPVSGQASWQSYILPTITVALASLPAPMRLTRSGMLDVLRSDYVRMARAKGLPVRVVLFKHALRNALLPVVSVLMVTFGYVLGGTVVVETVFALDGLGFEVFRAIQQADFPVVQTIVAFVSVVYIVLTLASDLINARLDPRIALG